MCLVAVVVGLVVAIGPGCCFVLLFWMVVILLVVLVIVVVIHYKLIYISSIIGDVYRYSRLATIQLLVY